MFRVDSVGKVRFFGFIIAVLGFVLVDVLSSSGRSCFVQVFQVNTFKRTWRLSQTWDFELVAYF